jgi:brefeldin A-inhibited guanine nucleotide-exchange protein 3
LAPLRQLSFAFYENSNSFYGDIATLKVAARRDCTLEEINRVYSLSQQVFQLDNQNSRDGNKALSEIKIINEDRSYAFLLYPNINADGNFVLRIPYRNLVIGLLVSQMLLQLIANILLGGLKCVPSELHSVIYEYNASAASTDKKPQFNLSYRAKEILYRCLRLYFNCSIEFDYRPGLKFLIQKVSNLDYAANLYKQCTSSFIILFMSLVDAYLSDIDKLNLSSYDLKYIIESCTNGGDGLIKKKEFFVRNLFLLREIWSQVSELYLSAAKTVSPAISIKRKESFINEINIVENKMVEIEEQLENGLTNYDTDDDVFLPSPMMSPIEYNNNRRIEKAPSEESVKIFQQQQQQQMQQEESNGSNNNNGSAVNTNPFITSSPTQQQQQQQQQQPQRENPFNRNVTADNKQQQQVVSPEIEQQRKLSILKDEQCKRKSLNQLLVASMELLKLLPNEATENVRLLFANTRITEAFDLMEKHEINLENYK